MEYITIIYNSETKKYYKDGKEVGKEDGYITVTWDKAEEDKKEVRKRIKDCLEQI